MERPVAIPNHVMNPYGDRALGHVLKNLQRRRVMFEDSPRDPGDQIEQPGSIRIVPRPFGMIEPEARLHQINCVAEQHQIDGYRRAELSSEPPSRRCGSKAANAGQIAGPK